MDDYDTKYCTQSVTGLIQMTLHVDCWNIYNETKK